MLAKMDATRTVALLRHCAGVFDLDISLVLWTGETVPLCASPTSALALEIRDPGVLARLLRRPRLASQIELFATGRIRILNGTLLDIEPRRADLARKLRAGLWRRIDKRLAFKALAPFALRTGSASPRSSRMLALPWQSDRR